MKKYLLVIVAAAAFVGYYFFSFIPFQPIVFEGDDQEYREIKVDSDFHKKLAVVLDVYYVEHKVKDGKVFIRRVTSLDKELISTFTLEALQLKPDSVRATPASQ